MAGVAPYGVSLQEPQLQPPTVQSAAPHVAAIPQVADFDLPHGHADGAHGAGPSYHHPPAMSFLPPEGTLRIMEIALNGQLQALPLAQMDPVSAAWLAELMAVQQQHQQQVVNSRHMYAQAIAAITAARLLQKGPYNTGDAPVPTRPAFVPPGHLLQLPMPPQAPAPVAHPTPDLGASYAAHQTHWAAYPTGEYAGGAQPMTRPGVGGHAPDGDHLAQLTAERNPPLAGVYRDDGLGMEEAIDGAGMEHSESIEPVGPQWEAGYQPPAPYDEPDRVMYVRNSSMAPWRVREQFGVPEGFIPKVEYALIKGGIGSGAFG